MQSATLEKEAEEAQLIAQSMVDEGLSSFAQRVEPPIQVSEIPEVSKNPETITLPSHLQIGGNYTYALVSPEGSDTTNGNLGGAQALYEYQAPRKIYGGTTFAWRQGNTSGASAKRSLLFFDAEERVGYTLSNENQSWCASLFTGIGYRYLGEDLTTGGNTLELNYSTFYVPVGMTCYYRVHPRATFGCNVQWMPQVYAMLGLDPLVGASWSLTEKLCSFAIELPIAIRLSNTWRFSLLLRPFFESWANGHTTARTQIGTSLNIPDIRYLFVGVNLDLRYSF